MVTSARRGLAGRATPLDGPFSPWRPQAPSGFRRRISPGKWPATGRPIFDGLPVTVLTITRYGVRWSATVRSVS